jgi:hypothetical protein
MKANVIILFLALIQAFLSYSVYITADEFYENRMKNGKTKPKVFDISYKYLPDWSDVKLLEYFIDVLVIIPIILIFALTSGKIYKEFSISLLVLHLIRSIFIHSTILPKTKNCVRGEYNWYNIVFGHCYDKIFSGHLSTSIISSIFLYTSGVIPYSSVLIGYNSILAVCLLLNRAHYTVDLLVALLASYTVFNIDKSVLHFLH